MLRSKNPLTAKRLNPKTDLNELGLAQGAGRIDLGRWDGMFIYRLGIVLRE